MRLVKSPSLLSNNMASKLIQKLSDLLGRKFSEQTSNQADELLVQLRRRNRKKRLENMKLTPEEERHLLRSGFTKIKDK